MKKQIEIAGKKIEYKLKVSRRAKRMRLTVYCGGGFVVTVPARFKENAMEQFIREKARWVITKLEYFKNRPAMVLIPNNKKDYLAFKNKALELARARIDHFNSRYGFKFNKINIKRQKSRWGSCSKKGNLNFNYKICRLPAELADYIIVHELCHLKEFNHGPGFWKLVSEIFPDYRGLRKELKKFKM